MSNGLPARTRADFRACRRQLFGFHLLIRRVGVAKTRVDFVSLSRARAAPSLPRRSLRLHILFGNAPGEITSQEAVTEL